LSRIEVIILSTPYHDSGYLWQSCKCYIFRTSVFAKSPRRLKKCGAFVWTTYAALQSLQAGLNQSADPAEIATWLKANKVDTVMGPLSWDEKGDLKGFEFGVFDWHANGTATDAK
jgi:ABC-type branched-subunit amino acid transport system substrate-binding protein